MHADEKRKKEERSQLYRLSGIGMEFASAIIGMLVLGLIIDYFAGTGQRWTVICLIIGIVGGMTNLIRAGYKLNRDAQRDYRDRLREKEERGR
ncbi:MAG: AtpZ/AtpI family protein [Phycisphaerales bacterium]